MTYGTMSYYDEAFKIGANLRRLRKAAQMTQSDLAHRMRQAGYRTWHAQTVGRAENGERHFKHGEVRQLAAILGVDVSALEAH